jgi:hypothetical protein
MIFTRGIARTTGRALAVKRANAALFGTNSVAPRVAPIFNANSSSRRNASPFNYGTDPSQCQLSIGNSLFGIMWADNLVRTMATEAKSTANMGKIDTVIGMFPSYIYNTN